MLTFLEVENSNYFKDILKSFDPQLTTWIVSDLKSKVDIQNICLEKYGYFTDESVLRVSDFWKIWLRRLRPDLHIVSTEFIKQLLNDFFVSDQVSEILQEHNIESHQYSTVFNYVYELAPVLLSPQSDQIIKDWISENKKSWYKWYLLSRLAIRYLLDKKKVTDAKWIPSLLQNEDIQLLNWDKNIFLDLGSEMTSVEFGLFNSLSKKLEVKVLVPDPKWRDKFKFLLNTYHLNKGFAKVEKLNSFNPESSQVKKYFRFPSEILEVKSSVKQVRKWMEQGIKPDHIGILSPRLEDYWPLLQMHLEAEGIPFNKNRVSSYIGLGSFQYLLSKINSFTNQISWETLEQAEFSEINHSENKNKFEKFKSFFLEMTESEELVRDELIYKTYFGKLSLIEKIDRTEFLLNIFKVWMGFNFQSNYENDPNELMAKAAKQLINTTINEKMSFSNWLEVFQNILSRLEVIISKGTTGGIEMRSIQAMHMSNLSHIIWIGLDESGFSKKNTTIPISDIEKLKSGFDFPLPYPEESHIEFNIRWLSDGDIEEQIFSCSLQSTQAEPLNTSLIILENSPKPTSEYDIIENPTFIDSEQAVSFLNGIPVGSKIQRDLIDLDHLVEKFNETNLSVTDINQYDHCHFKLLATRGFKLRDYAPISIDLDPRQRGSIVHALFEFLVQDKKYLKYNQQEVALFLEQKRKDYHLYPSMDDFWHIQKEKLIQSAEKFSQFESKRLSGKNVEHFTEKDFSLYLDKYTIKGRIDRFDVYKNEIGSSAVIYDYKRSKSSQTSYGVNWIKEKEYQLLLYLEALSTQFQLDDHAAYYFFYKNMNIGVGLSKENFEEVIHAPKNKSVVSKEEYLEIRIQFKKYMSEVISQLAIKNMTARPFRKEICADCEWREICRAPHL